MTDSLTLAAEHFNTIYRNNGLKKVENKAPNEHVFLEFAQHDPICSFDAYSYQYPMPPSQRSIPTNKETCDAVLQGLREHVDWVGTAENHPETVVYHEALAWHVTRCEDST